MIGLPRQVSPVCKSCGKPPLGEVKGSPENIPFSSTTPPPLTGCSAITMNQFKDSALVTPLGSPWWFIPATRLPWNMNIQLPLIRCHMYPGEDAGNKLVPDPMAFIDLNGPP